MRRLSWTPTLALAAALACGGTGDAPETDASAAPAPVVDVIAVDYAFQAPTEIPSGWTTFRMQNAGAEPHFLLLTRLPEGTTMEDYGREVGAVFGEVWRDLEAGAISKAEASERLGGSLPEWYVESAVPMGGPGLVTPRMTAETTVLLDPGTYVMECYVKTADGAFHAELGMVQPLVVSDSAGGGSPPDADIEIRLTNETIDAPSSMTPGRHVVAVHFVEHPPYGLGNDVHLARLDGAGTHEVAAWMDWMDGPGLRAPSPFPFLGGAEEMPAGFTAYFAVEVDSGLYAWVTETDPTRGMVREVAVP